MDIEDLSAYCAVVEAGTMSAAARTLGISQPGLSRRIARLEAEIGVVLLDRSRSGVVPTSAGDPFLRFARATLAAYDDVLAAARRSVAISGSVRVVASTTPGEYLVPALADELIRAHPDVRVEVEITDSEKVAAALLSGAAEVGFSGVRSNHSRLAETPIGRDEVVLAVPAHHRFARAAAVPAAELATEKLLCREPGSGTRSVVAAAFAAAGLRPPDCGAMTLGSASAVMAAVEAGLGIGFVSVRAFDDHPAELVKPVRVREVALRRDLLLVVEKGRPAAAAARALIELARALAAPADQRLPSPTARRT